ncbi:MAG TPA: NAD(P)-dependent oxidoreductase [Candidatus Acidoferrum sp.]|nr:NAD(P)-dependent oxidoreductase [Candidatus Acidoferrum sp.]
MSETLGFIGLGNMGAPIATNLLRAGYAVRVYNRTASKAAPLVEQGALPLKQPIDAAEPGGIVLTMLADDRALEEICLAKPSFVERLGRGGIHVSLSTISPATARRLANHHREFGVDYVASPVFGRPEAAAAAKLFVCVSGTRSAKKRALPILEKIGQGIFDFGEDSGAANVVKLCGNFLVASTVEALAEMMVLAEKNGISKKAVADMIGRFSPMHQGYANLIAEGRFEPAGFRLALGLKDINLILETAAASLTPMPFASLMHDRWVASIAKGRENLDWSAIALDVAEEAGIKTMVATP